MMNRIEKMLEDAKEQLEDAKGYSWEKRYEERVEFFKWLLEEVDELPPFELHQPRVTPTVWGMGDVSHHISIQLRKIKTPSSPVVLVFDYRPSTPTIKDR